VKVSVKVTRDTRNAGLDALRRRVENGKAEVFVGVPAGKTAPNGTPLAAVAAFNEFGTEDIPERPAFRRAIGSAAGRAELRGLSKRLLGSVVKGKMTEDVALEVLGQAGAARVKDEIRNGDFEPNAPSTIAKKGSDHPLIDTSQLINEVTYQVQKGPRR
jgi:hypothetical protein